MKLKKLKQLNKQSNAEVQDQDFILYNDKEDEREAINSLQYSRDSYLEDSSAWKGFYD